MECDLRKAFGLDAGEPDENVMYYEIHSCAPDGDALLAQLLPEIQGHVLRHTAGYIWQRDPWNLCLSSHQPPPYIKSQKQLASLSEFLWGALDFGDHLQDEWLVAALLFDLTSHFPTLVARTWDRDGQYLLIEAAYSLPRWLKPENEQYRVWIHSGSLHILPLSILPRSKASLSHALAVLQNLLQQKNDSFPKKNRGNMKASSFFSQEYSSPAIMRALQPKIAGLPHACVEQGMHTAHALLPRHIAACLNANPQGIAVAAEAFYLRTPDDVRAAATMKLARPTSCHPSNVPAPVHGEQSTDLLLVKVPMSRAHYAQFVLQKDYGPPKGWWPMPMPSEALYPAALLGCKIMCGFEILYASFLLEEDLLKKSPQFLSSDASATSPTTDSCDAGDLVMLRAKQETSAMWSACRKKLVALGYFDGVLEGSKAFLEREGKAKSAFEASHMVLLRDGCRPPQPASSPASRSFRVHHLLSQVLEWQKKFCEDPLSSTCIGLPDQVVVNDAGDESWLHGASELIEEDIARREAEMSRGISAKTQSFLDILSDIEGIKDDTRGDDDSGDDSECPFQVAAFTRELKRVLGGEDCLEKKPPLEASEVSGGGSTREGWSSECDSFYESEWEDAVTETDSDDVEESGEDELQEAYHHALESELAETSMAKSFCTSERCADMTAENEIFQKKSSMDAKNLLEEEKPTSETRGVDLDLNLVESLLAAHQGGDGNGLHGPAHTLLHALGIHTTDG